KISAQADGRYIVFCGVHFMAESADILARSDQHVILPDLNAGCSMADMAEIGQVEDCWEQLDRLGITGQDGASVTPLSYMNSTGTRGPCACQISWNPGDRSPGVPLGGLPESRPTRFH